MRNRPKLTDIKVNLGNGEATAEVVLSYRGDEHIGIAVGSDHDSARARLVGEATVRAVEQLSEDIGRIDLEAIGTTELGPTQVAIAQVLVSNHEGELVGSAVLRSDETALAAARAVLDALNRVIVK